MVGKAGLGKNEIHVMKKLIKLLNFKIKLLSAQNNVNKMMGKMYKTVE